VPEMLMLLQKEGVKKVRRICLGIAYQEHIKTRGFETLVIECIRPLKLPILRIISNLKRVRNDKIQKESSSFRLSQIRQDREKSTSKAPNLHGNHCLKKQVKEDVYACAKLNHLLLEQTARYGTYQLHE